MPDKILEFIDNWKKWDRHHEEALNTAVPNLRSNSPNWNRRLSEAGYFPVTTQFTEYSKWCKMHEWCREEFVDGYAWVGNTFWFEKSEHAIFFTLKWV